MQRCLLHIVYTRAEDGPGGPRAEPKHLNSEQRAGPITERAGPGRARKLGPSTARGRDFRPSTSVHPV